MPDLATGVTAAIAESRSNIYMDLPGVSRDNLEVELENDVLTVSGERPFPYSTEDGERVSQRIERGRGVARRRRPDVANPKARAAQAPPDRGWGRPGRAAHARRLDEL